MACTASQLPLHAVATIDDDSFDSIVLLANHLENDLRSHNLLDAFDSLQSLKQLNANFESEVTLAVVNKKRVIYSPTGPLNRDYDDVRRIADATRVGVQKALTAGSKKPLIVNTVRQSFPLADQVSLLAALEAAYIPLELREAKATSLLKVDKLGYFLADQTTSEKLIAAVNAIELGRIVTRDIGGSDPERMAAPKVLEYVRAVFESTDIKITVIEGQETFEKEYPLLAAVNRAANSVPRHQGRVIKLEYSPEGGAPIDTTVFLVGKGITYDTGGADIKAGGHMAGMHRDKCGAAFVAGFFRTLSLLKPAGLKVQGTMSVVRNSVGEECFVADEIVTSRAGVRCRIGNTDAEGRMVMADVLCEAKEQAIHAVNPHLFTIATLTGHVIRAYGEHYTGIVANGPCRAQKLDLQMQEIGELTGDPYEVSTLRREDYAVVAGKSEYEDLLQGTNNPSSAEPRGHQFPAAFLIRASGLDKHGNASEKSLPYLHVDIAGSSGPFPGIPTGSPIPSFYQKFIAPRL